MIAGIVGIVAAYFALPDSVTSMLTTAIDSYFGTQTVTDGPRTTGEVQVTDGDTLRIGDQKFRLYGVDAPESKQTCKNARGKEYACGQVSFQALQDKIGDQPVECVEKNKDRYQRSVAVCYVNGEDINAWLVENGYAVAYTDYGKDYVSQELTAKSEKAGVWQGKFEMPWAWRKQNR